MKGVVLGMKRRKKRARIYKYKLKHELSVRTHKIRHLLVKLLAPTLYKGASVTVLLSLMKKATWHRHLRGQIDYFVSLKGAIMIRAYNENLGELTEIGSTGYDPQIVRIPGIYWQSFKVISPEPGWLLYFVNKLYDYEKPDEERRSRNDQTIVPKSINSKTNDPRAGKSWDWLVPPHK